jgi:hypothetical protein
MKTLTLKELGVVFFLPVNLSRLDLYHHLLIVP